MGLVSAKGSEQIRAAVLLMRSVDKSIRRDITRRQRETMNPVWKGAVNQWAGSPMEGVNGRVVSAGVRIAAGNPPTMIAASSKRVIGRALVPDRDWAAFEYGVAQPRAYHRYERRNRKSDGFHVVKRRVNLHMSRRNPHGYMLGPAVRQVAPRMISLTVQSVVRAYMDAIDGKG